MRSVWAIDPGEVHVGVAEFVETDGQVEEVAAYETGPRILFAKLVGMGSLSGLDTVVIEEFRLYPWKMKEQGFSQIKTAEVIGVIRYLCAQYRIEWVQQPASIKKPMEGILKAKATGVFPSRGHGPHARDAELHGWYYFRQYLKAIGKGEK